MSRRLQILPWDSQLRNTKTFTRHLGIGTSTPSCVLLSLWSIYMTFPAPLGIFFKFALVLILMDPRSSPILTVTLWNLGRFAWIFLLPMKYYLTLLPTPFPLGRCKTWQYYIFCLYYISLKKITLHQSHHSLWRFHTSLLHQNRMNIMWKKMMLHFWPPLISSYYLSECPTCFFF